jgi:DNA gyrase subunit A
LRIAVDSIDAVIETIRKAADPDLARTGLMEGFGLTERQADAILAMQLRRLTGLERQKLEEEYRKLLDDIADFRDILAREERVLGIIRADVEMMVERYADARRTEISSELAGELLDEDLIPEQVMAVTVSHEGYIKTTPLSAYRAQHRGGKGITGAQTKEGDFLEHIFVASTHDALLFFTNLGRVYSLKVYEIPEMARTSRGRALINVIPLQTGEAVTSFIPVGQFDDRDIVMVTERGTIKKTTLAAFANILRKGIIAISLDENDKLIGVRPARPEQEIIIGTRNGRAVRFQGKEVRAMGRTARGVRGIRLRDGDLVVGMAVREPDTTLLTVCESGRGKRTDFDEYRETARGGMGVINIKTGDRNGRVVGIMSAREDERLAMITQQGKLQVIPVGEVKVLSRGTQGVKLMSLDDQDRIVACAKVPKEEIDEADERRALEEKQAAGPSLLPPETVEEEEQGEEGEESGAEGEEKPRSSRRRARDEEE